MRDVNNGWLIRYLHSNTASAFFFIVYLHIGRGMYYGSYRAPRTLVWTIGTVIFILMMATAFLGLSNSPKWFKFNNNTNNKLKQRNFSYRPFINGNKPKRIALASYFQRKEDWGCCAGIRHYSVASLPKSISQEVTKFVNEKNLNPVFIYEDLSDKTVRSRVLNETRGLSGIYLILNKVTLDYYIGSASTGRFNARFSNHLFNFNGSKVVKNAVKKHGVSSFAFMVLELFPDIVNKENNKRLLDLEDFYLKSLLPNYNILTEAGSSFGYKHNETTRLNMKANYSEQRRLAIGNLNRGKNLSASTIEAIRESSLNRTRPIYSEEAIQNMKKRSKPIIVYNMDYTVYGEFPSITEASESLGCSPKTINRALQTPKKILRRRWILKGTERYYSTSSKVTNNIILPTNNLTPVKLDPNFVSGFSDGEACFHIAFSKNIRYSTGWLIWPVFKIALHQKDLVLLESIRSYFELGVIRKQGDKSVSYMLTSVADIEVIINHFDKYPLLSQKLKDYVLFKQAFLIIKNKEHLTVEGVSKLVNIRASMNWGVPDSLKLAFPSITPVTRVEFLPQILKNSSWLAGFVAAEGCFFIRTWKSASNKTGIGIRLAFTITQHVRDEALLRSIIEYIHCGRIVSRLSATTCEVEVTKLSDILEKIIPFFSEHYLHGDKSNDFNDFKKAAFLMENKAHLTLEGLEELKP